MTSDLVTDKAVLIARELAKAPASKADMCRAHYISAPTAQRSLEWLRDTCRAPLTFDRKTRRWTLAEDWRVPTEHLPAWALRDELRALVGDADPIEVLRELLESRTPTVAGDLPKPVL